MYVIHRQNSSFELGDGGIKWNISAATLSVAGMQRDASIS